MVVILIVSFTSTATTTSCTSGKLPWLSPGTGNTTFLALDIGEAGDVAVVGNSSDPSLIDNKTLDDYLSVPVVLYFSSAMQLTWVSYIKESESYFHEAKFVMNGSQIIAKFSGYLCLFNSTSGALLNTYNLYNGYGYSVYAQNIFESTYQGT